MTLINSLSDVMNLMLSIFSMLPLTITALFTFIFGVSIIAMLAKKVSGG